MHEQPESEHRYCHNCHYPLPPQAKYCPQCSQKYTDGRETFGHMIHELIHTKLHLDAAFFNTLRHVFIPGKLTTEYFKGKHKRYAHPMRLFLVLGVFCFALIQSSFLHHEKEDTPHLDRSSEILAQFHMADRLDTLAEKWLHLHPNADAKAVYDSIYKLVVLPRDSFLLGDINFFSIEKKDMQFSMRDLYMLSDKELCEKYNIKGFIPELTLKQGRKSFLEGQHGIEQFFHQLFYTLVLMLPFVALLMKLLYWRKGHYFIEHFIFLVHYHCFLFLLLIPLLIFGEHTLEAVMPVAILTMSVFLFLALRRFYQQGLFKTLIKQIILFGFYMFTGILFILLAAIYTFITF